MREPADALAPEPDWAIDEWAFGDDEWPEPDPDDTWDEPADEELDEHGWAVPAGF